MHLPTPRGPITRSLLGHLRDHDPVRPADVDQLARRLRRGPDPLADGDLQLALAVCYELHYRGFEDVDDRWEWDPGLLDWRSRLEEVFEAALLEAVPRPPAPDASIDVALQALLDAAGGPSVAAHLLKHGTLEQYRDFVRQRSVYHLKEADPHSWAIPRLTARPKAALLEIQTDEYGGGDPARMHSVMFARVMRALGLDDTYGAYWDVASGPTFATVNAMSLFGLHRRLRGAILGHLAVLEMDSTGPNRRYAAGLRRLGLDGDATAFYDEHVEADAVHEQVAAVDLCGSFVAAEPDLTPDVLWGAACCILLDSAAAAHLLRSWDVELRPPAA